MDNSALSRDVTDIEVSPLHSYVINWSNAANIITIKVKEFIILAVVFVIV